MGGVAAAVQVLLGAEDHEPAAVRGGRVGVVDGVVLDDVVVGGVGLAVVRAAGDAEFRDVGDGVVGEVVAGRAEAADAVAIALQRPDLVGAVSGDGVVVGAVLQRDRIADRGGGLVAVD